MGTDMRKDVNSVEMKKFRGSSSKVAASGLPYLRTP